MSTPFNRKRFVICFLLVLPTLLAGCMDQSYRSTASKSVLPGGNSGGGTWHQDPDGGGGTDGPTDEDPADETEDQNENPVITASFTLTGVGGTKPSFNTGAEQIALKTDNLLKVTIRAGQAGALSLANGTQTPFTANYSCVSFLVTVGGRSVRTKPLLANGVASQFCPDGVAEQTIDFSDRLSPGNDNWPTVNVSEPRYDFYCQVWYSCQQYPNNYTYQCANSFPYAYYGSYCPTRAVFKNHTVTGDIDIKTNSY